jgi:hypothetical protein
VLKKPSRKNSEVVDVPADNPVGTMTRFRKGLRTVVLAKKQAVPAHKHNQRNGDPKIDSR